MSSEINKTAFNQICNETVSIQLCPNSVAVTLHSSTPVYISTTPVYWGSDYHADIRKPTATPNRTVISTSTTVTVASDRPILLKIVVPVAGAITGLLIVLLLVVISGLVCTCRIMKKRGKVEKSIMQNRYCLVRGLQLYYTMLIASIMCKLTIHKFKYPTLSMHACMQKPVGHA